MEDPVTAPVKDGEEGQGPREVADEWEADLHWHDKKCKKNPGHSNFIPIDQFNVDHLPPGCQDNDLVDLVRAVADLTVRVTVKYVSEKRPETFPGTDKPYPMYDKRGSNTTTVGTGCVSNVKKYPYKFDNKGFEEGLNSPTPKICDYEKCHTSPTPKTCDCEEPLTSPTPKICDCDESLTSPTPKTCFCKKCFTSPMSRTCNCKECLTSPTPKTQFAQIYIYTATHVVYDPLEAANTTCHLFFDSGATPALCSGVVTLTEPSMMFTDVNSDWCYLVFVTHDLELAEKLESMMVQCRRSSLLSYKNLPLGSEKMNSSPEGESSFDDLYDESTFIANSDTMVTNLSLTHVFDAPGGQSSFLDIMEDRTHPAKPFFQQTSTMNVESEKQISQPMADSASGFVEEELRPSKDLLYQCFGLNVESEKLGYPHESAEAKLDSLEEFMHSVKLLFGQGYGENVVDKQVHGIVDGYTSDMLEKIIYPARHALRHRSSMNADTKEQALQSILGSVSDLIEKTIDSYSNLPDQASSMGAGSDEPNFNCDMEPVFDVLKEHSKFFQHCKSKKGFTSSELESFSAATEKFENSVTPVMESVFRYMTNESEEQRPQPQPDPFLTLTIIVSHPHGCSKHVTIGQHTHYDMRNDFSTKFQYTTPTCPGSSGARVCLFRRNSLLLFPHHVHSGSSQIKKENFSASRFDIPLD